MILSNTEIHRAIDEGRLVIDPEPLPRVPTIGGENCPYDAHTVDLKLHEEVSVPKSGMFSIDLSRPGSISQAIINHSRQCILTEDQPFQLKTGQFILARTVEKIGLPWKVLEDKTLEG